MIGLTGRELERRGDIRVFQIGIVGKDLGATSPCGEEVKHVTDADPKTAECRSSAALFWVNSDSVEFAHVVNQLHCMSRRRTTTGVCSHATPRSTVPITYRTSSIDFFGAR